MSRFISKSYFSTQATICATNQVIVGPVDISNLDRYSLMYQNRHTAIAFLDLVVQVSYNASGTAADEPPAWANLNTTTLPCPSALGATATVITTAVDNTFHWLRILGKTATTATAGIFNVIIGGISTG
jgi:hypothetical protein